MNTVFLYFSKRIQMIKYAALFTAIFCISTQAQQNHHNLVIGTYTNSCASDGMYVYDFNTDTGETQLKGSTKNTVNPSFLTFSPDKKFVYSVNENGNDSQVSAFRFYSDSGNLQFLNSKSSEGNDPCNIVTDEKHVFVANYTGGNIAVFGKNEDGTIGRYKQVIKHEVQTVNTDKPEVSHMHMLQFSSDKKYLIASDLGKDYLYVYRYNPEEKTNVLDFSYFVRVKQGNGPRHFTFNSDGTLLYLINELDGSLLVFSFINGELKLIQETTIVDKKFKGKTSAADVHISADGKFLYATNRGDANTISCFAIKENGKLKLVQTISTLGKGPRNFVIDPSGKFLLVGHQYTNEVVIFLMDKTTGMLTDSGKRISLCSPVCLVFE
jgi:6-phosphogluconolactonase